MNRQFSTSRLVSAIIVLLFFHGLGAFSQTTPELNSAPDDTAVVISVVSAFNQAMVDRDKATLESLTMDELSYGHSSGKIENKEAFINEIVNGDFDFISTDTEDQTVLFSGAETALVRHIFLIEALNKGEEVSIRIGNMMVFKKQQNQWKLLARQAYKL
jgi:hypothetical protein